MRNIVRGITHNLPSIYYVIRLVAAKKRTSVPHWRRKTRSEKRETGGTQAPPSRSRFTSAYLDCAHRRLQYHQRIKRR
ncbi:MAG: hypothetical protein KAU52_10120, partial [Methanosarcinales archaeon]|nr:hypothetical protein [Methanosarcinales archaeon]